LGPAEAAPPAVGEDGWAALRRHTAARIALGRAGNSLPTREVLAFGLAHAQARDAVHTPLDCAALIGQLQQDGWGVLPVHSRAPDRAAYLARPDWGRRLDAASAAAVRAAAVGTAAPDVVFVIGDGLSSTAVQSHAAALLAAVRPLLGVPVLAPVVVCTQARVALADEVGELLAARLAVSLVGERPGLSAADSLGAYLTFGPRIGRSDAERNCISNIRPQGLDLPAAAAQLAALIDAALRAACSGVALAHVPTGELGSADRNQIAGNTIGQ